MKSVHNYIIFLAIILLFARCNITQNVPDSYYLLKKNNIQLSSKTEVGKEAIANIIRQRPNHRFLGFRIKLRMYNAIDSAKVEHSKHRRYLRYQKVNKRRLAKKDRIDKKRIEKALKKGKTKYKPRKVHLKDTLNPKPTFLAKLKYGFGEAPIIFDSTLMKDSKNQIQLFMQKNGYFQSEVTTAVKFDSTRQTAIVSYFITPKTPSIVDSMVLHTKNAVIKNNYQLFMKGNEGMKPPFRFDTEKLKNMRENLAKFMRNRSIYGFDESYINYTVDTLRKNHKITIDVNIAQRYVDKNEKRHLKPFAPTKVRDVRFHIIDSMDYKGNFKKNELDPRGIQLKSYDVIPTFDTLHYNGENGKLKNFGNATFLFNGKPTTRPKLIEYQNLLEGGEYYKGEYVKKSFKRLMNMDIFKIVKPYITENKDSSINVDYYLVPSKQQTFSFEPKATHSNSFLGVSSSLNYVNRNLFRQGYKLKVSLSGGFESQPEIFGTNDKSTVINKDIRSFNTIEFGPSIQLDVPNLVPFPLSFLSKSQNPKTTFYLAFNYQERPDFKRQILQWNYLWKFQDLFHNQMFTVGIPVIGGIQYVRIHKSDELEARLKALNDLFLINAYSNQAIYKDATVAYTFQNPNLKGGKLIFSYGFNFDMAGMIMSAITKNNPLNSDGYKEFLGQRYSQFVRLDNEFKLNQYINDKQSLHYHLQIGAGVPLKNNGPTLPFDYSFFAGGSNDNRGFRARTLGPGVYKYYLDTNRTLTQLGDMRLSASFEYRFKITSLFEGAFFADAGNVWTYNNDPNRPGGQISKDFYKQFALSAGVGLRLDFTYLIVRMDVGFPLRNPALPNSAQWVFQSREPYYQEGRDKWGKNPSTGKYYANDLLPKPFSPQFHIAIGYPF